MVLMGVRVLVGVGEGETQLRGAVGVKEGVNVGVSVIVLVGVISTMVTRAPLNGNPVNCGAPHALFPHIMLTLA